MWMCRTKGQEPSRRQKPRSGNRRLIMRRLHKDESGATAIEFAVVSLATIYFIVGIIEFAMAMTVGNSLEAATNLSSRLGKTGYVDTADELTQEQTIYEEVERRVGPMIDMTKLEISHEVYNDFKSLTTPDKYEDKNADGDTKDEGEWDDVDKDKFRDGDDGVGGSGNIVIYQITYPWKVMTPVIGNIIGDGGIINLSAYSVVKNEPY